MDELPLVEEGAGPVRNFKAAFAKWGKFGRRLYSLLRAKSLLTGEFHKELQKKFRLFSPDLTYERWMAHIH